MKDKDMQRWEQARQKGMLHFVIVRGTLSWGVPMFVVMTFMMGFHRLPLWQSALLWGIGGTLFGITLWLAMEYAYRKAMASRNR